MKIYSKLKIEYLGKKQIMLFGNTKKHQKLFLMDDETKVESGNWFPLFYLKPGTVLKKGIFLQQTKS